jgi:hypothetical protein
MPQQIVKLALRSLNISPPHRDKGIIISLGSVDETKPIKVEFIIDKKLVADNGNLTPKALREIATQLGMEIEEARFAIDDYSKERILKRAQD